MKRQIRALLLAILMSVSVFCAPALAASDSSAKTMTLEKTEGTVRVRNQRGKTLQLRTGGRLYSGYRLSTGEGYAWISLDDEKLIKLDWNTEVTLKKSGRRLEVMLESGELFFDVSEPLKSEEQLYIRTSTMYTGIRGTSGVVSTRENELRTGADLASHYSSLTVLDGRVQVTRAQKNNPNRMDTYYVDAGWRNEVALQMNGTDQNLTHTQTASRLEKLAPEEALKEDAFAAVEVKKDPELQHRIEQDNPGSELDDALEQSEDRLSEQQQQQGADSADQVQQEIQKLEQDNSGVQLDPVFRQPAGGGGGSPALPEYMVRFLYEGEEGQTTFAQLRVTEGKQAVQPVLTPTPREEGFWSEDGSSRFDFSKAIHSSVELIWVVSGY